MSGPVSKQENAFVLMYRNKRAATMGGNFLVSLGIVLGMYKWNGMFETPLTWPITGLFFFTGCMFLLRAYVSRNEIP